jgi:hypothetical protein
MALWTWVLIAWAVAASATVLWLAAKLSAKVELLAELSNGRDDLWGHGLPHGSSLDSATSPSQKLEAVSRWIIPQVRRGVVLITRPRG